MCPVADPSRAAACKAPITTRSCLNKRLAVASVPTIFLTHTPDMLANYYGERALAALRALAPVRLNETGAVLDAATLAREAKGCEIVVSDRQTAAPAELFPLMPDLFALLRVAVDIRNIDVE